MIERSVGEKIRLKRNIEREERKKIDRKRKKTRAEELMEICTEIKKSNEEKWRKRKEAEERKKKEREIEEIESLERMKRLNIAEEKKRSLL